MGPSIRYINQSAPFWDFVANLENQGIQHPFFSGNEGESSQRPSWGPWGGWNRGWQQDQGLPHRGAPTTAAAPGQEEEQSDETMTEKEAEKEPKEAEKADEGNPDQPNEGCRRKHCRGRRGHPHGFGPHGPHGPHGFGTNGPHGFGHHGPAHGFGPHRRGRPGFMPMRGHPAFEFISSMFQENEGADNQEFKPEVDVFDTEGSYVVHISLPGSKKEDIAVNWDAEKSELGVSGVVLRPGDEELLKTLALDERKVGAFDRKVRLGSRANPAQVDVEGITAKLDGGILIIDVPKIGGEGFVEVKKVDVE